MPRINATHVVLIALMTPLYSGFGPSVSAQELRDPMQPPPFALQKFREARWAGKPEKSEAKVEIPKQKPLQLTSILYAKDRKIAIINDQMLSVGDRIRGAELVKLTRATARLVRKGKVINLSLDNGLTAIKRKAVESEL